MSDLDIFQPDTPYREKCIEPGCDHDAMTEEEEAAWEHTRAHVNTLHDLCTGADIAGAACDDRDAWIDALPWAFAEASAWTGMTDEQFDNAIIDMRNIRAEKLAAMAEEGEDA
jgi:hypothetical protein